MNAPIRSVAVVRGLCAAVAILTTAAMSFGQTSSNVRILDVPYIQQTEALCGGAAAAMVMRYWGATGVSAESFALLVDATAGGIRGQALIDDLVRRGWDARSFRGDAALVASRLEAGQPVIALIEDRPGAFHYVVVVAWTNGRVIYHDPARTPFRVVDDATFDRVWEKSNRWTMLALPGASGSASPSTTKPEPRSPSGTGPSPCEGLVESGVRSAGAGAYAAALETFASAADLCPSASAPLREAAGVYAVQRKWNDAARLARAALARDGRDEHAWRILATSAYVSGDAATALEAWNAVGEPTVDLVTVEGLQHTRHAAATGLLGVHAGETVTPRRLSAAEKRLGELPAAGTARVRYEPLGGGRALVRGVVIERPRWPASRTAIAVLGIRSITDREVAAAASSLLGGGEVLSASWRWWENRPRVGVSYAAPSAAGVWRAELYRESHAFSGGPDREVERRRGGAFSLSNWTPTLLRWEVTAALDSWSGEGRTAHAGLALDQRIAADRVSIHGAVGAFSGAFSAASVSAGARWQTTARREATQLLTTAGAAFVSARAPRATWPGAGTGHARATLLRAHPLLDDGSISGDVFGRRLYHCSVEARRWSRPILQVVRIAPAVFVDVARATHRLSPEDAWHVDAGAGLRVALPGAGVLRLDVGKGLRDGSTAVSVGWITW